MIFAHLFSTVGLSMEVHECGSEKSYAIFGLMLNAACECDHNSQEHKSDCCKDKKVQVKADQKAKISAKTQIDNRQIALLHEPTRILSIEAPLQQIEAQSLFLGVAYPPWHAPPLYLLYNVYLI